MKQTPTVIHSLGTVDEIVQLLLDEGYDLEDGWSTSARPAFLIDFDQLQDVMLIAPHVRLRLREQTMDDGSGGQYIHYYLALTIEESR